MAADSPAERAHWRSVIKAYDGYMQYHLSANHARRMALLALPKAFRGVYEQLGYRDKLDAVDEGIRRNAEFLDEMIADPVFAEMLAEPQPEGSRAQAEDGGAGHAHAHAHGHSHDHSQDASADHDSQQSHGGTPGTPTSKGDDKSERHAAQDKVRSTLRSFVRDWSAEGAAEREACYEPCIRALKKHYEERMQTRIRTRHADAGSSGHGQEIGAGEERARGDVRVLVPGCGLGRLAMEIAAQGFESQGNEFSAYMLIASNWVLNQSDEANSHAIHPFLHSFSNHLSTTNLLRAVPIPDVCPKDVLGSGQGGAFSLVAGDFEEIYGVALDEDEHESGAVADGDGHETAGSKARQRGQWGAVVTCFFIDCARNVLQFLRIIHALLEEDGVWINIGPLLWHFENSPTTGKNGEGSIELSLDEVKELARTVGFEIRHEEQVRTTYTGIPGGMLRHEYNAAFWTATKIKSP